MNLPPSWRQRRNSPRPCRTTPTKRLSMARCPPHQKKGRQWSLPDPGVTGSTLTEDTSSDKTGAGEPQLGFNAANKSLDRGRADSSGRALTTNQGVPVADNQHSLKAGLRGPALLEDFILREKITHFDHERIPERIVHARGSAAHGYFECYESLERYTRASLFAERARERPFLCVSPP